MNDFRGNDYFRGQDFERFAPLTQVQEAKLFQRYAAVKTSRARVKIRNEIIARYLRYTYSLTRRGDYSPLTHDEVVSVANRGLLDAIQRFKLLGGARFSHFLKLTVRGMLMNARRAAQQQQERITARGLVPPEYAAQPAEEDAYDLLFRRERVDLVRRAMRQLRPRPRLVLEEYYLKHRTFADIGRQIGLSLEAVRQEHMRALRVLREILESYEDKKLS